MLSALGIRRPSTLGMLTIGGPGENSIVMTSPLVNALPGATDCLTTLPIGNVVKQSVAPGSAFTNGEVITIEFSPGPPMVNIPNVDGLRIPKAESILRKLGFVVQITPVGPFNVVFDYNPKGQAPKGSAITLTTG